jgi:hypothetical protein
MSTEIAALKIGAASAYGESNLLALLQRSVAAFNALTLEQQREHRAEQRKSWVVGEMLLEHPEMTREHVERIYDEVVF